MSRVVVTGVGCVSALGIGFEASLEAMFAGRVQPISRDALVNDLTAPPAVFEVHGDLLLDGRPNSTRSSRLAVTAAVEAVGTSWGTTIEVPPERVAVCMGTTVGSTFNEEEFYAAYLRNERPGVGAIRRYLDNDVARVLADHVGARGPVTTVANACASGTDAIGLAAMWLDAGLCDVAIAGGADELARFPFLGFAALKNSSPERCRPFDRDRRGLNLGEGAGVVVLERADSARERSAPVLGGVAAYASAADAHHLTAPHPDGRGLRQALAQALDIAGMTGADIGFVNAHGTGTKENDRIEGRVLSDLVTPGTPVVSTKGYTGHTLGAAGGVEAVLSLGAMREGRAPVNVGFEVHDPECVLTPTTEIVGIERGVALSTSLAFGGANSVLLLTAEEAS